MTSIAHQGLGYRDFCALSHAYKLEAYKRAGTRRGVQMGGETSGGCTNAYMYLHEFAVKAQSTL